MSERIVVSGIAPMVEQEPTVQIPDLPDDAPPEQLLDWAAMIGFARASDAFGHRGPGFAARVGRAYLAKWHPEAVS